MTGETRLLITEKQFYRMLSPHVVSDPSWRGGAYVRFAQSNVNLEELADRLRESARPTDLPDSDFFYEV